MTTCGDEPVILWLLLNNEGQGLKVHYGEVCKVMGQATAADGVEKYQVRCGSSTGWVSGEYLLFP